ncbi:PR domain zinc finger protein 5-like isoform X2 [Zerene cesonia]|uniref:PR domain zinc finger protein 5-like isoform X2 n=1 Tax=Zerene cesonia TaxID=33412 RepID=UPI0018E57072|nr:PR domain zinc finger protein 5-like isoform X2 [Zerene cesonia]
MTNCIKPLVFCEGCLSTDRKLADVGEFYDIYVKLFIDEASSKLSKNPLFCWECNAMLRTIHKFRERVEQANSYLNEGLNNSINKKICLSNLSISNVSDNIIYAIHSEDNELNNFKVEESAVNDYFNNIPLLNETLIPPIELKAENSPNDSDFENDFSIDTDYVNVEIEKVDTDNIEDDKKIVLEKCAIDKTRKPKRRKSYTNVRYIVKELSKEEMSVMRKNCKRVVMEDDEIALWREKAKLARNYRVRAYKCETCISGFAKKQHYDEHVKKFHTKTSGEYECDICNQRVPDRRLPSHAKLHNTKYVCCVCSVECHPIHNLDSHLNSMHKTVVECIKCKLQFRHRMECNSHYIKTHMRVICDYCGNGFTSKKRLINHIGSRHTEHRCKICDKLYTSLDTLKRHNLSAHVKSVSEETYCVECNMHFNNEYLFKRHLLTSTKHRQKRFPCPECDKVYHKRTTLNNHYNHVHLQKTKNYCELCDRTNRILQNHMRTHTGERPFHCDFCTASFTQKNALVSHTRAIHKVN